METVNLVGKIVREVTAEDAISHSPEDGAGEPSITTAGVCWTDTRAVEHVGKILEPGAPAKFADYARAFLREAALAVQALSVAKEEFDVPQLGEVGSNDVKETALVFRKTLRSQELDEIAKVVSAVEGKPVHFVRKDETRCGEQRSELVEVNAHFAVLLELNAALLQKLDRGLREHVFVEVEFEVEHPGARKVHQIVRIRRLSVQLADEGRIRLLRWQVAFRCPHCDSKLDGLEKVDIGA